MMRACTVLVPLMVGAALGGFSIFDFRFLIDAAGPSCLRASVPPCLPVGLSSCLPPSLIRTSSFVIDSGFGFRASSLPASPSSLRRFVASSLPPSGFGIRASAASSPIENQKSKIKNLTRLLTFRDYNTRVVVLGTACLGLAAGMIGTFMLLRKRALVGDALSHATLPGIAAAFMIMVAAGGSGKWMPGLLAGAALSGLLGVGWILLIRHYTRLKEDAALGIVLSVMFGMGVALLGIIQNMSTGSQAGLESFIYGKTASMLWNDALLIALVALLAALLCLALFKELAMLCFDEGYAAAGGWPVRRLDLALMAMVTAVTVIGLQAVGLVLVLAMLIIPPAAARFWTDRLGWMLAAAAAIGAASGMIGAAVSAVVADMPAGAVIVLTATAIFILSLLFGPARGVLVRLVRHLSLRRRIASQHLLRSIYELQETTAAPVSIPALLQRRSWTPRGLKRLLRQAKRRGLILIDERGARFTEMGLRQAQRLVRNHRLWELFLIRHADIAPSHVDRDADAIEHVLGRQMVQDLEAAMRAQEAVPPSPHSLAHGGHP